MKLILGDSEEKIKELKENSVDAGITDPPYGWSFMGKKWDYDVPSVDTWKECFRVLKPGGHILVACGTRTQHRMCVNIEDAGFEIRDIVAWVYGSGFPKSLNIGKAVDKLQGNDREVTGIDPSSAPDLRDVGAMSKEAIGIDKLSCGQNPRPAERKEIEVTKGSSPYEGWGTALKPAMELWTLARKPLGQEELDISKNICYNIIKKGFINKGDKILWRIKNVKNVEKLKTKLCSTQTQQQKMVVISAEVVEMKENKSVGKKIQKLIESICVNGEKDILNEQDGQAKNTTGQIKKGYHNIGKHTKEKEKKNVSSNMEENVSAVGKQNLSHLPLTTNMAEEGSIGNQSKTQISMSSSKKQDTQKKNIDCSVATATSQWVCMDIARTIKISFEGKEYDFDQLIDGSFVWNENLEPYRKSCKLTVAENVLKWGTGGINIDGCRVEHNEPEKITNRKQRSAGWNPDTCGFDSTKNNTASANPQGRFPANLIHDGSDEVVDLFPDTKQGKASGYNFEKGNQDNPSRNVTNIKSGVHFADSGSAARFFYCAKASKKERNKGCEGLENEKFTAGNYSQSPICKTCDKTLNGTNDHTKCSGEVYYREMESKNTKNHHPTVKPITLMRYLCRLITPNGGTILDPYMGSGSTGIAAKQEGFDFIGIEKKPEYLEIAKKRIEATQERLF